MTITLALALLPGVSRSGVTITASRLVGLNREAAARFSFLLALPIIAGAGGAKGLDLMQHGFQGYGVQFLAGFLAAAVSGFLVIWFLLRYLRTHDFLVFMLYRLAVGHRGRYGYDALVFLHQVDCSLREHRGIRRRRGGFFDELTR